MRWASASRRWSIPPSGQQNPVLGQFLSILATFLFLAIDGHLALAAIVVESYRALPPGDAWLSAESAARPGPVSAACCSPPGLSIALPVAFAHHPRPDRDGHARPLGAAAQPVRGRLPGRLARRHRPARHRRAGDRRGHHRGDQRRARRSAPARDWAAEPCPTTPDQDQKTEAPTPKRRREARRRATSSSRASSAPRWSCSSAPPGSRSPGR